VVQPKTAEDYRKRAAELRILAKSYPPELHDTLIEVAETYEAVALTVESVAHTTASIGWETWRADGDPKAITTAASSRIFSTRNNLVGSVGDDGRVSDQAGRPRGFVLADGSVSNVERIALGLVTSDGTVLDAAHKTIGFVGHDGSIANLRRTRLGRVEPPNNVLHGGAGLLLLLQ
jgi:hypothetical protein